MPTPQAWAQLTTLTLVSLSLTNAGLVEATNNGVLDINGVIVNNQGGNITANGAGATVQLYGNADIEGGTLTNNGGAFFGTPDGKTAILDGSTAAGAVTINGTYTNGNNSTTFLLGTINNQGNILLNGGSGNDSDLEIDSANVTLTGGGTVTLSTASGGGNAMIFQAAGGLTLENFNNTIQGAGTHRGQRIVVAERRRWNNPCQRAGPDSAHQSVAERSPTTAHSRRMPAPQLRWSSCYLLHQLQRQHADRRHLQRLRDHRLTGDDSRSIRWAIPAAKSSTTPPPFCWTAPTPTSWTRRAWMPCLTSPTTGRGQLHHPGRAELHQPKQH